MGNPLNQIFQRAKVNLSRGQKREIRKAYGKAISEMSEPEAEYVRLKIRSKINMLQNSSVAWLRDLAMLCEELFSRVSEDESKKPGLSEEEVKCVTAALFYFVDPYDIIPDHVRGIGYLDDMYVINLCAERLGRSRTGKKVLQALQSAQ